MALCVMPRVDDIASRGDDYAKIIDMKDVILTGIRSNEEPTLANYLGAFVPMVEMQRQFAGEYQINMFVPDLNSFTMQIEDVAAYDIARQNLKYGVGVGLGGEHHVNKIASSGADSLNAASASILGAEGIVAHSLEITILG